MRVSCSTLLVAVLCGSLAFPTQVLGQKPRASRQVQLRSYSASLNANRVGCALFAGWDLCSPGYQETMVGGWWPQPTFDNYIYRSGLQAAGIIPAGAGGGRPAFAWAGDTVGAFFVDLRGDQEVGERLALLYDSRSAKDLVVWPNGAVIRDPALFDVRFLGLPAASDQDIWTRYWDGNARLVYQRPHPMGIAVDQRAMAWNSPDANRDILYFVFTLTNVTARDLAAYANPTIDPALRGELAAIGARFQDSSEAQLGVSIPDGGYPLDSVYVALVMDADIGTTVSNYSTALLPFRLAAAYQSDFGQPPYYWTFPLEIFGAPFAKAPGFVGTMIARTPADTTGVARGTAIFTGFTGGGTGYPDPVGVPQLFRYLSGASSPADGDNPCTFQGQQLTLHFCFVAQVPADTRYALSTGPFALPAGESRTIVLAYLFAAPSAVINPWIGSDVKPGYPATGDSIAADTAKLRLIDRAAGWITQADANANGRIEPREVRTLPRSLLAKAQLAQAFVDNRFLTGSAPAAPDFFLIPGENQVTVVWQKSPTETTGDPYFALASDPTSGLYDPNFRQFDVEGYRIYRGRDPAALQLVAQFDYQGTTFTDYLGALAYPGDCAPELGILTDCPVAFDTVPPYTHGYSRDIYFDYVAATPAIQVLPGGRIAQNGQVFIVRTDTAVSGAGSGYPYLQDNRVAFTFVDRGARSSFDYVYAVTAFDVNSIVSGPSSLESPRVLKRVTPRAGSGQEAAGQLGTLEFLGGDGQPLPSIAEPTINAATGRFSGPMPPVDTSYGGGLDFTLVSFLPELLADSGAVTLTVDSILPGAVLNGRNPVYYLTSQGSGQPTSLAVPIAQDPYSGDGFVGGTARAAFPATNLDSAQSARFGGNSSYAIYGSTEILVSGTWRITGWGRGSINGDPSNSDFNGPRWWDGTNETTNDPNGSHCAPALGTCNNPPSGTLFPVRTAGALAGVDTIFHVLAYSTVQNVPMRNLEALTAGVARAADFAVYWGANGAIDSVIDVTHRMPVPFSPKIRASWGILTDSSFANTVAALTADSQNTLLTWSDIFCVDPAPAYLAVCGGGAQTPAVLMNHARLSPIVAGRFSSYAGTAALAAGGNGFIFYLNGHFFLMQLRALPPAGRVWHARFYSGVITGSAAAGDFAFTEAVRPPAVPGLRARIAYTGSALDPTRTADSLLALVHTVPDPYYVTDALETSATNKVLKFVHLPAQAIIRIYSVSGVLVQILTHDDPTGGGEVTWDLRSREGRHVASGVYFFHVEAADHRTRVGRFTIVMKSADIPW